MKSEVTNVKVKIDDLTSKRACLSWEAEGAHWHYWLNANLQAEAGVGRTKPTLYKRREGKEKPQRLDLLTKEGKLRPMPDMAFTFALQHGMFINAEKRAHAREERRLQESETDAREARKRGAGLVMFDALTTIVPLITDWENDLRNYAHRKVHEAIKAAIDGTAGTAYPN